jgi:hypothetical protein
VQQGEALSRHTARLRPLCGSAIRSDKRYTTTVLLGGINLCVLPMRIRIADTYAYYLGGKLVVLIWQNPPY